MAPRHNLVDVHICICSLPTTPLRHPLLYLREAGDTTMRCTSTKLAEPPRHPRLYLREAGDTTATPQSRCISVIVATLKRLRFAPEEASAYYFFAFSLQRLRTSSGGKGFSLQVWRSLISFINTASASAALLWSVDSCLSLVLSSIF